MIEILVDGRRVRSTSGNVWRGDPTLILAADAAMGSFTFEAQMGDAELLAARHVAEKLGGRIVRVSTPRETIDRRRVQ